MNTIVVADSDTVTRAALVSYLERQQPIPVTGVASREDLYRQMTLKLLSLIIFDLRLEQGEFTLLRRIRERSNVPIIVTADERKRADQVAGLELGADDYIVRPFGLRELLARIQALLRRSKRRQAISLRNPVSHGYRFGGWHLDSGTRCLTDPGGTRVSLTKREYRLLVAFLAAPGRTLTREQLIDSTQIHRDVLDRVIDGQVWRLRRRLQVAEAVTNVIQTERGHGYRFVLPVEIVGPTRAVRFSS
jgi:two-component system OmpR family response regulator